MSYFLLSSPLQAPRSFMRVSTLHTTHPRATLATSYRSPVPTVVAELSLWRSTSRRRCSVARSIRQRRGSQKRVELYRIQRWRHRAVDGEKRVVVADDGEMRGSGRRWHGRPWCCLGGGRGYGNDGTLPSDTPWSCRRASWHRRLLLLRELCFFVVEPVLDLTLILDDPPRILRLRHRDLPGYRNALLRVVVSFQFRYPPSNRRLLSCGQLILAALAARLCCSALFVLGVDRNFRGIVARVDDIRPARRDGRGRVWEYFDVWHVW
jgi:hypothetical protein